MALKFMWGFEIGADVDYYANSNWGISQNQSTGSDYALYDTQYYEAHQPINGVGGGSRCLKQSSYYQHNIENLGSPHNLLAFSGTYSELTTPVTGGTTPFEWQNGFVHFSFKHDFQMDFDLAAAGGTDVLGKWIHLCTLGSASITGSTPFFDGGIIDGSNDSDWWMPLPGDAPAGGTFLEKGFKPNSYISFYLVRQENAAEDPPTDRTGGPCLTTGDFVVAVVYYNNDDSLVPPFKTPADAIYSSSLPVDIEPDTWVQYAINYNARSGLNGDVQVWQDGTLVLSELSVETRDVSANKIWNSVTFSPHGKYVCKNNLEFPGGVWPEYSNLVDHVFLWDEGNLATQAQATASLFIQGLQPNDDHLNGDFLNDTGFTTPNLYDFINDPGDPNPMEVDYIFCGTNTPTSCSFIVPNVVDVVNGATSWNLSYIKEFIGAGTIAACTKLGPPSATNYQGSILMGQQSTADWIGSGSLIETNQLVWGHRETQIVDPSSEWNVSSINAIKCGFKVEPE